MVPQARIGEEPMFASGALAAQRADSGLSERIE